MGEENKNLLEQGAEMAENAATAVGNAVVSEVKDTITSTVETVKGAAKLADAAGDAIGGAYNWLTASSEERAAKKAQEEAEKAAAQAEQKKAEEEAAAAEEAEKQRLEELKDTYILHTAMITCSFAVRPSRVQIPISHGIYIHGIDQLNVGDSVPLVNIKTFGVCTSPANPSVQAAAAKIQKEVQERSKGFIDKVMDFFCKKPKEEPDADLVSQCAGVCNPMIFMPWIDGKEEVLIDGKPALLGRCKLTCGYNGAIEIYTDGVCEEMINQVESEKKEKAASAAQPVGSTSTGKAPSTRKAAVGSGAAVALMGSSLGAVSKKMGKSGLEPVKYKTVKHNIPRVLAGNIVKVGMIGPKPYNPNVFKVNMIENSYKNTKSDIKKLIKDRKWTTLMENMDDISQKGVNLLKGVCGSVVKAGNEKEFEKMLNAKKPVTLQGKNRLEGLKNYFKEEKKKTLINGNQLKQFQWHDTSDKEIDYFNKVLKEYGITNKSSITLFMATLGMESGRGSKKLEEYYGNLSYFNDKKYKVDERGAGYIQITSKKTHEIFLKSSQIRDNYSGTKTAEYIASHYPLEAAAWFWIEGTSIKLNEYSAKYGAKKGIFLVTQYFVNGCPEGIDNDLGKIRAGVSYEIIERKKGDTNGTLKVNGHTWRLPNGWEYRENSYNDAIQIFN